MTLDIEEIARQVDCVHVNLAGDRAKAIERLTAFAVEVAKRSMQGSAEPVAIYQLRSNYPGNGWFDIDKETYNRTRLDQCRIVYTAPPAPVSAEPAQAQIDAAINALSGVDYLGGVDVGIKVLRNQIADLEQKNDAMFESWKNRSAPPSTDAKDSELLEALKSGVRAAELALFVIRKQNVMPNSSWESGFNSDLNKAKAAIAVKEAGK